MGRRRSLSGYLWPCIGVGAVCFSALAWAAPPRSNKAATGQVRLEQSWHDVWATDFLRTINLSQDQAAGALPLLLEGGNLYTERYGKAPQILPDLESGYRRLLEHIARRRKPDDDFLRAIMTLRDRETQYDDYYQRVAQLEEKVLDLLTADQQRIARAYEPRLHRLFLRPQDPDPQDYDLLGRIRPANDPLDAQLQEARILAQETGPYFGNIAIYALQPPGNVLVCQIAGKRPPEAVQHSLELRQQGTKDYPIDRFYVQSGNVASIKRDISLRNLFDELSLSGPQLGRLVEAAATAGRLRREFEQTLDPYNTRPTVTIPMLQQAQQELQAYGVASEQSKSKFYSWFTVGRPDVPFGQVQYPPAKFDADLVQLEIAIQQALSNEQVETLLKYRPKLIPESYHDDLVRLGLIQDDTSLAEWLGRVRKLPAAAQDREIQQMVERESQRLSSYDPEYAEKRRQDLERAVHEVAQMPDADFEAQSRKLAEQLRPVDPDYLARKREADLRRRQNRPGIVTDLLLSEDALRILSELQQLGRRKP